jgi:hypothetical protein
MKIKTTLVTVLAAMLAVTSVFADQASLVAELRAKPTENFSKKNYQEIKLLASADAMVYFQDHKDYTLETFRLGTAHAYKHNMIGDDAMRYAVSFVQTFGELVRPD